MKIRSDDEVVVISGKDKGKTGKVLRVDRKRGRRQERRGVVVSSAMDKTIVVRVDKVKAHPKYKKIVRRSSKLHAHDERNDAGTGDTVRVVECRPMSRTKRWRLTDVLEKAK